MNNRFSSLKPSSPSSPSTQSSSTLSSPHQFKKQQSNKTFEPKPDINLNPFKNRNPSQQNRNPSQQNRNPSNQNRNASQENRNQSQENRNQSQENRNPSQQNRKFNQPKNQFISGFNLIPENFPELNEDIKNSILAIDSEKPEKTDEPSYLEKIKIEKNKKLIKRLVPPGWIILSKLTRPTQRTSLTQTSTSNQKFLIEDGTDYNNPTKSKNILNDRIEYRNELNNILGDISPYWDMSLYDDDEDDDDDDEDDYDEDDYEYEYDD